MFRPSVKSIPNLRVLGKRFAGHRGGQGSSDHTLARRPLKKIKLGKARPAIYHQFNCNTELSDGSIVVRRSQFPKTELRLIQDQRNHPLWNPNRADLEVVDVNAGGRMARFKQRYADFDIEENIKDDIEKKQASEGSEKSAASTEDAESEAADETENLMMDEYLELLGTNAQEVQKGGKVATKASRRRK